jgi:protein-L-isoaspartate(D-aspartate) O-methyltransferase
MRLAARTSACRIAVVASTLTAGDAVSLPLPQADLIYVNAGVVAPPLHWLRALRPGGRMIFPWRPSKTVGIAALVTRTPSGFDLKPLMPAYFIPCVGASEAAAESASPDPGAAWRTRSLQLTSERAPDATATATYPDVWFSSSPLP